MVRTWHFYCQDWVQHLVRELISCKPCSAAKKKKCTEGKFGNQKSPQLFNSWNHRGSVKMGAPQPSEPPQEIAYLESRVKKRIP